MHPIENIIKTSMEEINRMVDVNTVIGDPIDTGCGTVLLPVSRVSLGFTIGGGEYGSGSMKKPCYDAESGSHYPFAGVSAVGMCLKPMAFLSMEQGNVRVLPASPSCLTDRLADLVPQVLKSLDKHMTAVVDNIGKKCENSNNKECCEACVQAEAEYRAEETE